MAPIRSRPEKKQVHMEHSYYNWSDGRVLEVGERMKTNFGTDGPVYMILALQTHPQYVGGEWCIQFYAREADRDADFDAPLGTPASGPMIEVYVGGEHGDIAMPREMMASFDSAGWLTNRRWVTMTLIGGEPSVCAFRLTAIEFRE